FAEGDGVSCDGTQNSEANPDKNDRYVVSDPARRAAAVPVNSDSVTCSPMLPIPASIRSVNAGSYVLSPSRQESPRHVALPSSRIANGIPCTTYRLNSLPG